MKARKLKDLCGLTLSELMVAAAILALTLSAFLFTFVSCLLLNESNNNLVIAANDAQFVMERLRGKALVEVGTYDPSTLNLANLRNESVALVSNPAATPGVLEVTVYLNWTERGRNRSYVLSTQLTR